MTDLRIDTGYKPHPYQLQVHVGALRFTVVVAHRRFGKTFLAVNTLLHGALASTTGNAVFAYLAPFLRQAKAVAWELLKAASHAIPGAAVNESELTVTLPNGSRIRLFGADNADALRGMGFNGVVIDELADIKPGVWAGVVRPALSDRHGWCLFIGTPRGLDQFSDLYNYATAGSDPEWASFIFRADETNIIDPAELASAKLTMSDALYRQEMLCDFTASSDNVLIGIDLVSTACARVMTLGSNHGLPKILGVDVARYGSDRSVIQRRQGLMAFEPAVMGGIDNMTLANRVAAEINAWDPDAVFIDAGRGEGVIDRLRQMNYAVIEVNFGGKPINARHLNRRAEMWDLLRQWLVDGGALPANLELKFDLVAPTYDFDSAGRLRLESKDDIKARGLRSPDLADALCLTFAAPVAVRRRPGDGGPRRPLVAVEYDPFR